jgi:putative transposase
MPRKPREEVADGIHHVWARGNDRQLIYREDEDCLLYLDLLAAEIERKRWRLFAYCLMGNHLHLLLQTPDPNLGAGMQRLQGTYALLFNRRHRKVGHVFQGRFGSKLVRDDAQFWTATRYVLRNPVEAGRCRNAVEWRWSSHRGVLDGTQPAWLDRRRLLERFASMGGDPDSVYQTLVDG